MAEPVAETARLLLRGWRDEDFAALHALCTDERVMATIGPPNTEERSRALLGRLQQRHAEDGSTFWAMERKSDARVIGFCGAGRPTVPQLVGKVEIGWRLAFDCWGQSYAREAAQATLRWMSANRPGEAAWAITAASNSRSQGLMKRLGMHYCDGMDFLHPMVADDSPLKPHVTFVLEDLSEYAA